MKDACLPKYLLVVADFDPLHDLPDVFHHNASTIISDIIYWMVPQINSIVRHKHLDLLDKKPGSLSGFTTHIIFVRMLRCIGSFRPGSTLQAICDKRAKLNDALNDAVAKINQHILTINTCSPYEHFNHKGLLSIHGKSNFWQELDGLMERFNKNKIKLLPNPKNPPQPRSAIPKQEATEVYFTSTWHQ